MDVAKRLDFDPTEPLSMPATQARFDTANMAALHDLQKAVEELSAAARKKQGQIVDLAKQSAEQGIGDNDLKRLKRQFDSNKATFVNIDQKQRFMKGLYELDMDIEQLTIAKDQHEQQLEKEAEALRTLKAQNEQARTKLANTSSSISQLYSLVDQATGSATAQLQATAAVLQQQAASSSRQPADDAPLEPGPGQVEAQQLVEAETAQAKELERSIAAAEAELSELESRSAAGRQELAALRAEVERLEVLASDRAKAADEDTHTRDKAKWCEDMLSLRSHLTGVTLLDSSNEQLLLGINLRLPTSRQQQDGAGGGSSSSSVATRQVQHELLLQLLPCAGGSGVLLSGAKLSPSVPDVRAFLDAAIDGSDISLSYVVAEVRQRLLSYWARQVLVEAAAEVYPPSSSSRGPPHVRVGLPNQVEAEVLVPWTWPSGPQPLQLVALSCPELPAAAAQSVMDSVNGNEQLLSGCDLLGLLKHVGELVDGQLLDAAAAGMA